MLARIGVGLFFTYILLALAIAAGWILNLIDIIHSIAGPLTTLLVLRIVGLFVAPLGAILGWFW